MHFSTCMQKHPPLPPGAGSLRDAAHWEQAWRLLMQRCM